VSCLAVTPRGNHRGADGKLEEAIELYLKTFTDGEKEEILKHQHTERRLA